MRVELPSVVGAFDGCAVELTKRKRKRAVRANVAQGERFSSAITANDKRHFEQGSARELAFVDLAAAQRGIPESP